MLQANNSIQVHNNGAGVPVEIHKEEKIYVPELIFGHLLTSSNYNDKEKKVHLISDISWHTSPTHTPRALQPSVALMPGQEGTDGISSVTTHAEISQNDQTTNNAHAKLLRSVIDAIDRAQVLQYAKQES